MVTDSKSVKPWEREDCKEPPPTPAAFGAKDLGMNFITEAPEPPPPPQGPPMEPGDKHELGLVGTDSKEDEELRKKMPTATPEEIMAYKESQAKAKAKPPAPAPPKPATTGGTK